MVYEPIESGTGRKSLGSGQGRSCREIDDTLKRRLMPVMRVRGWHYLEIMRAILKERRSKRAGGEMFKERRWQ